MRSLILWLSLGLLACGSSSSDDDGEAPIDTRGGTLSVTLLPSTQFGCSTQFSMDANGSAFGRPAELLTVNAPTGPVDAEIYIYRTDEPPEFCPPEEPWVWLGATGDVHDFDPPVEFGPGSAITLRVDCDACEGNEKFTATFELRDLEL